MFSYIYNFKSPLIGTFYVSRITNNKTEELMLTCKRSSAQWRKLFKRIASKIFFANELFSHQENIF